MPSGESRPGESASLPPKQKVQRSVVARPNPPAEKSGFSLPKGTFSWLGGLGGGAIGSLFGPAGTAVGSNIGSAAGNVLSTVFGTGEYKISNSFDPRGRNPAYATFKNKGDGIRICHREFLRNVTGSVGFNSFELRLNPGSYDTFPWLSTIAVNFEEWKCHGILFEFVTTSGQLSGASPALGVVVIATQYDPDDTTFRTKVQMESSLGSVSGVPCANLAHGVECAPAELPTKILRIRHGDFVDPAEYGFYDIGLTTIATEGNSSEYVVGELHISYDVEFFKPRVNPGGEQASFCHYVSSPPGSATAALPGGSAGLVRRDATGHMRVDVAYVSGSTAVTDFSFKAGTTYFVTHDAEGATITGNAGRTVIAGEIDDIAIFSNNTNGSAQAYTSTSFSRNWIFRAVTDTIIRFTTGATLTAGDVDFFVLEMPSAPKFRRPNTRHFRPSIVERRVRELSDIDDWHSDVVTPPPVATKTPSLCRGRN